MSSSKTFSLDTAYLPQLTSSRSMWNLWQEYQYLGEAGFDWISGSAIFGNPLTRTVLVAGSYLAWNWANYPFFVANHEAGHGARIIAMHGAPTYYWNNGGANATIFSFIGIGFAVPSNAVRQVVPALSKGQTVARPWLGVSVGQATDGTGALLGSIVAGGPAADAGLRVGDVVESIDGKPVNDSTDLVQIVNGDHVGQTLELKVRRAGKQVTVKVTVGTRPKTSATTSGGGTTP